MCQVGLGWGLDGKRQGVWFNYGFCLLQLCTTTQLMNQRQSQQVGTIWGNGRTGGAGKNSWAQGSDMLCDLNPVISPSEPISNICQMGWKNTSQSEDFMRACIALLSFQCIEGDQEMMVPIPSPQPWF